MITKFSLFIFLAKFNSNNYWMFCSKLRSSVVISSHCLVCNSLVTFIDILAFSTI